MLITEGLMLVRETFTAGAVCVFLGGVFVRVVLPSMSHIDTASVPVFLYFQKLTLLEWAILTVG